MFILDSLFLSGFRWVIDTVVTAAEAERNDDSALREELLAAEMRREMGEISDEEFAEIEGDVLARIREIKERRDGGSGPIVFGEALDTSGSQLAVEASVSGDFHEPAGNADSGTIIEGTLVEPGPVSAKRSRKRAARTAHVTKTKTSRRTKIR